MSGPETEAARRILSETSEPVSHDATRETLEAFYALVQLLPAEESDELVGAAPEPSDAVPPGGGRGTEARRRRRRTVAVPVVAIIAALLFVTALLFVPRGGFAPQDAVYLSGTGAARAARGVVLVGRRRTIVFASGLSELTPGYRYVAWRVDDEGYERIGSMVTLGGGRARLRVELLVEAEQIEVTIEPSASTGAPDGPTVLAGFRSLE